MDQPLPARNDGPGLWLVSWHRSGNTRYGNRGDITVRFERSTDEEPHYREWRDGGFRYEAQWYGRIVEELSDGGVTNEAGHRFAPALFAWHRRSQTSHPPGIAPPADGPY